MSTLRLLTRVARAACWTQKQHLKVIRSTNMGQHCGLLLCSASTKYVNVAPMVTARYAFSTKKCPDLSGKTESKMSPELVDEEIFGSDSKLGLFAKFKLMYKKYWYVLIPVHVITSVGWFGGFYYLSQSGVDIPALLQHLHLSESIIERFQHSNMGHFAIAYLCYKIATPLRYAVTLGGTTVSIKYLVQAGHIKPLPSKKEFIQMYEQKKADRAAKHETAERVAKQEEAERVTEQEETEKKSKPRQKE